MKKAYTLFLLITVLLSVFMYGCKFIGNKKLETIMYSVAEDSTIFSTNEKESEKFKKSEYKENIFNSTITIDVLGVRYTGIYETTVKLPCSDMIIYDYKIQGTENGRVLVDSKTGAVVEYVCIPHNESLITEDDYINFVKKIIGGDHDLAEYSYSCATHYYERGPKFFRSRMIRGFKICEENESLGSYSFFYSKYENGVSVPDHISAEIDEDTFYLEVYEYDYKSTVFSPILDKIDEVEASIENHLLNSLKEGFTLVSIEYGSKSVFVQDGNPYIMISSTVTYKTEHGDEFSTVVKTITG